MKKSMMRKIIPLFLAMALTAGLTLNVGAMSIDSDEYAQNLSVSGKTANVTNFDDAELLLPNSVSATRSNNIAHTSNTRNQSFYQEYVGYITQVGGQVGVWPIAVDPGEVLHAQLDPPNSSMLDYDLYLLEWNSSNNTFGAQVDYSEYATYMNGANGSLPEAVGVYNNGSVTKEYAVIVASWAGASSTIPFNLRIGIAETTDTTKWRQNAFNAYSLSLNISSATVVNSKAMVTQCDNDVYEIFVPGNLSYNEINIGLDTASINAGYKAEIYTFSGYQGVLRPTPYALTAGGYLYVRVSAESASALTGANYTLTITPITTPPPTPTYTVSALTFGGGTPNITYNEGTRYRIHQREYLDISGTVTNASTNLPAANVQVTVEILDYEWSPSSSNYMKTHFFNVFTDSNGQFFVSIQTMNAYAARSYYLGGAVPMTHWYDVGAVTVKINNKVLRTTDIYIYGYTTF